ncbi:MAG: TIGR01620 family protein, partial [Xanthobacteraceae bacterium]|nr:TIGR01620 family protein [Xanthobacteraceae bacterium]
MTRPESFRPDDPRVAVASPDEPLLTRAELREIEAAEAANLPAVVEPAQKKSRFWGKLFWSAAGGLVSLALGLAVANLVQSLFSYAPWLGWFALALTALAGLALFVIAMRELIAIFRLEKI